MSLFLGQIMRPILYVYIFLFFNKLCKCIYAQYKWIVIVSFLIPESAYFSEVLWHLWGWLLSPIWLVYVP